MRIRDTAVDVSRKKNRTDASNERTNCRGNGHTNCFSSELSLPKYVSHTFEGFAPSTLVEDLPQKEKKGIKSIFRKTTCSHKQYNLT